MTPGLEQQTIGDLLLFPTVSAAQTNGITCTPEQPECTCCPQGVICPDIPPCGGPVPVSLTLAKADATGAMLRLTWAGSCAVDDNDHAIYSGAIGEFSAHTPLHCTDPGTPGEEQIAAEPGDRYYVVVPLDGPFEGAYGLSSSGRHRVPSASPCRVRRIELTCP